jgi:hypothetical protein
VTVWEGGCSATSDPYVIVSQPVAWLDTVGGRVGERLRMKLLLAPPLIASDGISGYTVRLRLDSRALFPHGAVTGGATPNGLKYQPDGSIVIDRSLTNGAVAGNVLFELELEGLATGGALNVVELESVYLNGLGKLPIAGPGLVLLNGCDIANGFSFGRRARIESARPNPVSNELQVTYHAPEGALPILRLRNSAGQIVFREVLPIGTGTSSDATVDVSRQSSGIYLIELVDGAEHDGVSVVIVK